MLCRYKQVSFMQSTVLLIHVLCTVVKFLTINTIAIRYVCGMSYLQKLDNCLIYSIGGNNQWQFENAMLEQTKCDVHTFDCTGEIDRFQVPKNDRLHFHHICLGAKPAIGLGDACVPGTNGANPQLCGDTMTLEQMQKQFKHNKIDLLKMYVSN